MTEHILVPLAVLQAAVDELLEQCTPYSGHIQRFQESLANLRALLDVPCEPVGSLIIDKNRGTHVTAITSQPFDATCLPLYAPEEQL